MTETARPSEESDPRDAARRLVAHVDAAPSPYHAVARAAALLDAAGFAAVDEGAGWDAGLPDRWYVHRGGALVASVWPAGRPPTSGLRVVGAHTDSPNLRLKPRPSSLRAGWQRLGVEVYGGPLLASWLDRDLGLAGRVAVGDGAGTRTVLVDLDGPVARIPQLAIHLDREVNQSGPGVDPHEHLRPLWATEGEGDVVRAIAAAAGGDPLAWDLMFYDRQGATLAGPNDELLVGGRLDNLVSSFLAVEALITVAEDDSGGEGPVPVVCLFDHEEVGSVSATGAAGQFLPRLLTHAHRARGGPPRRSTGPWRRRPACRPTWRTPPTRTGPSATMPSTRSGSTPVRW